MSIPQFSTLNHGVTHAPTSLELVDIKKRLRIIFDGDVGCRLCLVFKPGVRMGLSDGFRLWRLASHGS